MSTHFAFQIPDGWTDYHLTTEDFVQRRAELRARATTDEQRNGVDEMVRTAREFVARARRQGAVSAAGVLEMTADGLEMAFVMAAGLEIPEDDESTLPGLVRNLTRPAVTEDGLGRRTAGMVVLPKAGPAARVSGTEIVEVTPEVSVAMATMTTIIPVPGLARAFVVLTSLSPNLPLIDDLMTQFADIADTFTFTIGAA